MKAKLNWSAMSAEQRTCLVAEAVMGWEVPAHCRSKTGRSDSTPDFGRVPGTKNEWKKLPAYSTSITAAFEVVEKLSGDFQFSMNTTCDKGLWDVEVFSASELKTVAVTVFKPLPEAICKAALLAVGVDIE